MVTGRDVWWPGYRRDAQGRVTVRMSLMVRFVGLVALLGVSLFGLAIVVRAAGERDGVGIVGAVVTAAVIGSLSAGFVAIVIRTRLEASGEGLVLCNGFRTVRLGWSEIVCCGGMHFLAPGPVLGLGPGGHAEVVPLGRIRRMRRGERRRLLADRQRTLTLTGQVGFWFRGQNFVIEIDASDRPIPVGDLWGGMATVRTTMGGLLVVATGGRAFLSGAVPTGWVFPRNRRRFARLLCDIVDVRAR